VREAAERFGVAIRSWCLMSNHVHFVAVPEGEKSLALCFGRAHTQYTRMVNFRNGWRGHLWQGRFGSSPMDEAHAFHAVRYVLRNPVRAGVVRLPWRYEWPSAAFHVGDRKTDPLVKETADLDGMVGKWREYLVEPEADEVLCRLRRETAVRGPLGSADFVQRLEEDLDRHLTRRPPGRPRRGRRNR
jgi:putative transposase